MQLLEDDGQKIGQHLLKNNWWNLNDIEVIRVPLPVGDYALANELTADVIKRKSDRNMPVKKMDFLGTYKVAVDTKKDITEIEGNICGKAHARFRDECILAQNNGIKLYVLVENSDGITDIKDLFSYTSKRRMNYFRIKKAHEEGKMLSRSIPKQAPVSGQTLAKAMLTMQLKYGVTFLFCRPNDSGRKVIELLGQGE